MSFQVGDRVIFVGASDGSSLHFADGKSPIDRQGTVCNTDPGHFPPVGVRWDEEVERGHSCINHCDSGFGWFVFDREIRPIYDPVDDLSNVDQTMEDII